MLAGHVPGGHQDPVGRPWWIVGQQPRVVNVRPIRGERVQHVIDPFEIAGRQREPMCREQPLANEVSGFLSQAALRLHARVSGKELFDGAVGVQIRWPFAREQPRDELRSIRRELEQCLVQEMQAPVLQPHVHDDGHGGTDLGDVAEVLFRPDPDVHASPRSKRAHDLGVLDFVGHDIVRVGERARRLGQVGDQLPELLVGQLRGQVRPPEQAAAALGNRAGHDQQGAEGCMGSLSRREGHGLQSTLPEQAAAATGRRFRQNRCHGGRKSPRIQARFPRVTADRSTPNGWCFELIDVA